MFCNRNSSIDIPNYTFNPLNINITRKLKNSTNTYNYSVHFKPLKNILKSCIYLKNYMHIGKQKNSYIKDRSFECSLARTGCRSTQIGWETGLAVAGKSMELAWVNVSRIVVNGEGAWLHDGPALEDRGIVGETVCACLHTGFRLYCDCSDCSDGPDFIV